MMEQKVTNMFLTDEQSSLLGIKSFNFEPEQYIQVNDTRYTLDEFNRVGDYLLGGTKLTDDQQVVLEWLKEKMKLTDIEPIELIWRLKVNSTKAGYRDMPVYKSYRYMTKAGQFQVLAAFAEWGMKQC